MALISATEARAYLPQVVGSELDTQLSTWIDQAGVAIARYCHFPGATPTTAPTLEDATYTLYSGTGRVFVSEDRRTLFVEPAPIVSVTSIHEDSDEVFAASTLIDSGDYSIREGAIRLKPLSSHGFFDATPGAIKIVFVAGWATIPDDLKRACGLLVAHYHNLKSGRQGVSSLSINEANTAYREETIPASVRELLAPYVLASAFGVT